MVYDGGNNCQQYENEINKSTAEQGERNEGSGREKGERCLEKQKHIGQDSIKQERQREWSRHRERGKKRVADRRRSQMKGVGLKKAEAEKQN